MYTLFPKATPESAGMKAGFSEAMNTMARSDLDSGLVGGVSMAVVSQGKLVYEGYHGWADKEEGRPITPDCLFRAASMSKPVTAVAIMIQVEAGLLSLDDPVSRYLPVLGGMSVAETDNEGKLLGTHKAPRDFTLRDLLTHSSGLGSGPWFWNFCQKPGYEDNDTLATKIPDWADSLLQFDPGTAFSYSPRVGFEVLGHLVELTSGMGFDEFLAKKLYAPLGMTDTCFVPTEEQWSRMVGAYATQEDGSILRAQHMDRVVFAGGPPTYFSGGGGLATTLEDYIRFAGMLQGYGTLGDVQILKRETVEQMQTRQIPLMLPGTDAAYSWGLGMRVVLEDNGSQAPLGKGAFGWSGAYGTHFWCDPVHDVFAVLMSNMTTAGGSAALPARHIEKVVMDHLA